MNQKLKSLPTHLSTQEISKLLDQFPSNAKIERGDEIVKVHTPTGVLVLRGAMMVPGKWHVMAVEGLIKPIITAEPGNGNN